MIAKAILIILCCIIVLLLINLRITLRIEEGIKIGSAECKFIDPSKIYPYDKEKEEFLIFLIDRSEYLYPGFWSNGTLLELSLLSSQL